MRIVFSGGGTGGHIFPAIAIANKLKKKRPDAEILFVGAKDKLEMEKVPKAGYEIRGLWISGFHRGNIRRNILFPVKLVFSLWASWRILRKFKPQVVVGVGGFASGPILEMSTRLGIPSLIQEQNSYPGITNRLLGKKVDSICVAYDKMDRYFPAGKIIKTGNPVREDILKYRELDKNNIEDFKWNPGDKTILLFGGSLGARSLNDAVEANAALIENRKDVHLIWQVGKLYFEEFRKTKIAQLPNVHIREFLERMDVAYAMADVIICRAGASTISELCTVGKPAILIPSPNVAEDHQTKNAMALSEIGAAMMIPDADASQRMIREAFRLIDNADMQKQMSEAILKMAIVNADDVISDEIIRIGQRT